MLFFVCLFSTLELHPENTPREYLIPVQDRDFKTGNDGAVVKSSANGLVGTGFEYRYWLQPRAGVYITTIGRCKAANFVLSSFSLTSNMVNSNY